ncbi:VRR-NUC domain-containing protein [Marinobacter sediminum]|uniref:VRR-NUC domain-containing protein n=1 Tax=Marinobacter sediminum TaxID=256323 RepID=UPI00202FD3AB|nr:VRR-NUC domain-containing protein [Marinobacter sediminum]MCM0613898.1 VRR-NUC domain-containing protein [Marinobacter sediminum]
MATRTPMHRQPGTADLENPLYYLENMETVVGWVLNHHADLLTGSEHRWLKSFLNLSVPARALLTRMVMRSGELFRSDKLSYPELTVPESEALDELIADDWLDARPLLPLDQLFRLYTLGELRPVFAEACKEQELPRTLPKARMLEALQPRFSDSRPLADWLGEAGPPVVRLNHMALFDRIRLMFFGNLRQNWSDFVLVELGHQRYEPVTFSTDSRAFDKRQDVDCYLAMHQCREWLDEGVPARQVWPEVPPPADNPWLTSRRDRLLLELGRQAERQGERELALEALAASGHREARLKQLRLLERMKRFRVAWAIAADWQTGQLSDAEAQGLARILKRLAPKVNETSPPVPTPTAIREFTLTLPQPLQGSVEFAVQQHLWRDDAPVFYVENTLINGLFGLLCWQTVFEAIPGAFFHPFHVGPADLTREDFVDRRRASFDRCFAHLEDGSYRQRILDNFAAKQGIANPFVVWPVINEDLLVLALDCISPAHLRTLFQRLLLNLKEHRSGFPDLIQFHPDHRESDARYEMIEVKGPGDRLQDHQTRWLGFFASEGIPASVCYVRWQTSGDPE